jgi:hypothetical protein
MLMETCRFLLVGFLCVQLLFVGCTHVSTIDKPQFASLKKGKPVSEEQLARIHQESPKDSVFADMLQAYLLMRTGDLKQKSVRKEIQGLLATSVNSFEDLSDPVNYSHAFSADEDKAFRGAPYERMDAAIKAAVFAMADGDCQMAKPYLRNAEFLDARFQKLPFGTDAPLVYALMYRCLASEKAPASDIQRAYDGIFRSVRFLTMQESMIKSLVDLADAQMRPMAIANRLAFMILEISIYNSLIGAPNQASYAELIDDAAHNADLFISSLQTHFTAEYQNSLAPELKELAKIYGLNEKKGREYLEGLAINQLGLETKNIGSKLKEMYRKLPEYQKPLDDGMKKTHSLTDQIVAAAKSPKMVLSFEGMGPTLERKGSYQEVAVIKTSPTGTDDPRIRHKKIKTPTTCGFHRTHDGGFSVVLCGDNVSAGKSQAVAMPALELLGLSRKAKMIGGRKFDEVLKGRAQFRAATENIAEISAWSALFLFYMGAAMIDDCNRRGQGQACYAPGLALWAVGGLTIVFSGTVWLIGRSSNPSADSRFIPWMYESTWVAVGGGNE